MRRTIQNLLILATFASGCVGEVSAHADVADMCSFELSVPRMDPGPSGTRVVTTTLRVKSCPGTWQPTKASVCIAPEGAAGDCVSVYGWGPGEASMPASASGGIYTATAQGCARVNVELERCVPVGPVLATVGPTAQLAPLL